MGSSVEHLGSVGGKSHAVAVHDFGVHHKYKAILLCGAT